MTDAIWPETLTPTVCMSRKFCGSSFRPILWMTREDIGKAEIPAAPIMGLIFLPFGRNRFRNFATRPPPAVSNLLLHRTELLFRRPATGTVPVGRQLLEGRTRDDSVLRIACGRIVNPPANAAFILFHGFVV